MRLFPYLAVTIASCLTGVVGLFVRHIGLGGEAIVFARIGLGLVFLTCFLGYRGGFRKPGFVFSRYSLISGLALALCMVCYVKAIQLTALANAALLLYLGPLLAVLLAAVWPGERISIPCGLLLVLAFLGCGLILQGGLESGVVAIQGNLLGLLAAFFYAVFIVANRLIPTGVNPMARAFYQFLTGTAVLLPWAGSGFGMLDTVSELVWLVGLGFFHGFVAVTLMIVAIESLKTYQYGTLSYLEPVVAVLAGVAFYDETLTLWQVLGGLAILMGGVGQIWLVKRDAR